MTEFNGIRAEGEAPTPSQSLFGPRVALEKSAPMAGFAQHETTTAKKLRDIENKLDAWDWRKDATADGVPASGRVPDKPSSPRRLLAPRIRAFIAVGVVVVVAAVGGIVWATSGSKSPAPIAPGHSAAAIQFKAANAQSTTAGIRLATGFSNLKGLPTIAAVSAFSDPYTSALGTYVGQLDRIKWTPAELAPSRALENQVKGFITFLHTIHTISPDGLGAWINTLYAHVASMTSAAGDLSQSLGLPLTPST